MCALDCSNIAIKTKNEWIKIVKLKIQKLQIDMHSKFKDLRKIDLKLFWNKLFNHILYGLLYVKLFYMGMDKASCLLVVFIAWNSAQLIATRKLSKHISDVIILFKIYPNVRKTIRFSKVHQCRFKNPPLCLRSCKNNTLKISHS